MAVTYPDYTSGINFSEQLFGKENALSTLEKQIGAKYQEVFGQPMPPATSLQRAIKQIAGSLESHDPKEAKAFLTEAKAWVEDALKAADTDYERNQLNQLNSSIDEKLQDLESRATTPDPTTPDATTPKPTTPTTPGAPVDPKAIEQQAKQKADQVVADTAKAINDFAAKHNIKVDAKSWDTNGDGKVSDNGELTKLAAAVNSQAKQMGLEKELGAAVKAASGGLINAGLAAADDPAASAALRKDPVNDAAYKILEAQWKAAPKMAPQPTEGQPTTGQPTASPKPTPQTTDFSTPPTTDRKDIKNPTRVYDAGPVQPGDDLKLGDKIWVRSDTDNDGKIDKISVGHVIMNPSNSKLFIVPGDWTVNPKPTSGQGNPNVPIPTGNYNPITGGMVSNPDPVEPKPVVA